MAKSPKGGLDGPHLKDIFGECAKRVYTCHVLHDMYTCHMYIHVISLYFIYSVSVTLHSQTRLGHAGTVQGRLAGDDLPLRRCGGGVGGEEVYE